MSDQTVKTSQKQEGKTMKIKINEPETEEDITTTKLFREAVAAAKKRQRLMHKPVAGYNRKDGAYLEYPDGKRKYFQKNH